MQGICSTMMAITMLTTPIFLLVWVVRKLRKRPAGQVKRAALISAACFVAFTALGIAVTDTCDHEYELVESEAATCEKDGYEKYHCDLCGRDKTEKPKKLGHDMVEVRRVEPTYDADGEYVRKCSRCGYEEVEVLKKLENPTEATKPTETEEPTEEPDEIDLSVTYDEIYKAYKENELVADDLYQYNRYRITATINGMSTSGLLNLTGGATLTMEKRVGNTIVFFYAEFEKAQEEALKTIKVGDTITFEGECLSAGMWSDCELITE